MQFSGAPIYYCFIPIKCFHRLSLSWISVGTFTVTMFTEDKHSALRAWKRSRETRCWTQCKGCQTQPLYHLCITARFSLFSLLLSDWRDTWGVISSLRPRAQQQLQLTNYLVAWMEHTNLHDSARTGSFFLAVTYYIKQCA